MAKTTSHSNAQGAFSFFEEIEKVEQHAKPQKNTLRPPSQVLVAEEVHLNNDDAAPLSNVKGNEDHNSGVDIEVLGMTDAAISIGDRLSSDIGNGIVEGNETTELDTFDSSSAIGQDSEDVLNTGDEGVKYVPNVKKNTRGRKSIKEHTAAAVLIEMPTDEVLYSKLYYSMGEVTAMFKENHSLIRYWESEFDILKPKKNGKGDRFFKPADVKNLYLIYDLLRRRKFTIDGARAYLKNIKSAEERFAAIQSLEKIKSFFWELKAAL